MMARRPKHRAWRSGSIFERGGRWTIRFRDHGRRCSASYPTKELAERVLAKVTMDIAAGGAGLPRPARDAATLAELAKPWLENRKATHRSWDADAGRWKLHLLPRFGKLRPDELDQAAIRSAVEAMLSERLTSATCHRVVSLLSSLFTDLCERGIAKANPAKGLPRATRRLLKSSHDPRTTPFVEKRGDMERIYHALPEPVSLAYALGALGGLRVGEILALRWANVDLEHRRIIVSEQVQDGKILPPKDKDSRVVPIMDSLLPILQAARLRTGGQGLVVPPMRGGCRRHLDPHTLGKCLREAFAELAEKGATLPPMTWYQATRHTFASQWVLDGGSLERLRVVMGHSTVLVTERYAHLRGDVFTPADLGRVAVDFSAQAGKVLPMVRPGPGEDGHAVATGKVEGGAG
jgi:integrase